jgi:hypothetical protein
MSLHRRQFVIAATPVSIDESWRSVPIGGGLHLSYHQALPVEDTRDRDGGTWHLLGIALQADPLQAPPLAEIARTRTHEVEDLVATWAGRWILVGDGALRTDAGSLFTCFYGPSEGDGLVVSSSPALIRDQIGAGELSPPLRYEQGMDWFPPPASRFGRIRRLLPSQALALSNGERPVWPRPLMATRAEAPYDETLEQLETEIRTVLRNLAGTERRMWLALTGGYDSRVLLAALWREELDFATFTFEVPGMSDADRVLPSLLAKEAGVPHHFIGREHFDVDRVRTFEAHIAGHTADLGRELYAFRQYDQLPANGVEILTTLFELGSGYYGQKLPSKPDEVVRSIEQAFGFAEHHAESFAHREGIREWSRWIEAHPEPAMDWRDRFYWEQRGAGWAGAFFQGNDLIVESVSPVNCQSIMSAMLGIDPAKRRGKRWEVDLVYRMAPFLADHPYAVGGPLSARLRRGAAAFLHHPSKLRFATGRMRLIAARKLSSHVGSLVAALASVDLA